MAYDGPERIVILGAGIGGLAAADAITRALVEQPDPLPPGLSVQVFEARDAPGGRAASWSLDAPEFREQHPHAPWGAASPHGLHFVWGSYQHFLRFARELGVELSPTPGTPTYCLWLAPPDTPGDALTPGRIVALHVCDPEHPEQAWDARAAAVLGTHQRSGPAIRWLERTLSWLLLADVSVTDWLSYVDILFDEENISAQLRWSMFLIGVLPGFLGQPEENDSLRRLLGGRDPADVDIAELMRPLFERHLVLPRMRRAHTVLGRFLGRGADSAQGGGLVRAVARALGGTVRGAERLVGAATERFEALSRGTRFEPGAIGAAEGIAAVAAFTSLVLRDSATILSELRSYDPRESGYLRNALKLAFSSPYGLDIATAMRDVQFGLRSHGGAVLQTFDGDDARKLWQAARERIEKRFGPRGLRGGFEHGLWAKRIALREGRVERVDLTPHVDSVPSGVPTVEPPAGGQVVRSEPADAVVSNLLPQCLAPLLEADGPRQADFVRDMRRLGQFMNETVNLQLFFPEKVRLPFVEPPPGSKERPPFSISNLEGLFTILVDLERAWSREAFEAIALRRDDVDVPFRGSAFELVGGWADVFTHDARAHRSRYQWPLGVQQVLARLYHDPDDYEPWSVDRRPWPHGGSGVGHVVPPVFGQVKAGRRREYLRRWRSEAAPIVVAHTLRQLAELPGLDARASDRFEDRARSLERGEEIDFRYVLTRNCRAEEKFFSAEPGIFGLRPHSRFETPVAGLWVTGDWTRNGCNGQSMEAALVSGLQAAYGVIEAMRAGGLPRIRPPEIDRDIMPPGAWDPGG